MSTRKCNDDAVVIGPDQTTRDILDIYSQTFGQDG